MTTSEAKKRAPKLILLNGPAGVGKSTLARRYTDGNAMTLCLEIDAVGGMLGSWLEQSERSGSAAREIALAMAATHLRAGYDVIVPQLLARRELSNNSVPSLKRRERLSARSP